MEYSNRCWFVLDIAGGICFSARCPVGVFASRSSEGFSKAESVHVFLSADCLGARVLEDFPAFTPMAIGSANDFCSPGLGGALTACFHCRKRAVCHGPI